MKPPLIQINSDQFRTRTLEKNRKLSEFRSLPSVTVDPNERNVFVEASKIKVDKVKIIDVILMDMVSIIL